MANSTALSNAPSRRIFAPMFRARWQNMQNIINDSVYLEMIPAAYKPYYLTYINQWKEWSSGFVLQLHRSDFFSVGMGYTVCDILTKKCMSGGFRIHSTDEETQKFFEEWSTENSLIELFNKMFFFSNSVGNAILVLTPIDGVLYPSVYPVNRCVFQIGRTKEITQILLLNRFIAGESTYYAREKRIMLNGVPYWKVEVCEGGLVTAPAWGNNPLYKIPLEIKEQWHYNYGDILPNKWYRMPDKMRNIGCYNVKNKSVAVALCDLAGYSDSSLHTALDILYSIDYNYTQAQVDQYLAKGRALIPKVMSGVTIGGNMPTLAMGKTFQQAVEMNEQPLDDVFFTKVADNNLNGEPIKPTFIQPDLRGEERKAIKDGDLQTLAAKVGLSASDLSSHLATNSSGAKTDDEIIAETTMTENSVNNKRSLANEAINTMLNDVAYFYDLPCDVDIQWGRTAVNSSRENAELMADYQAGTLSLREYLRRRWTDLAEDDIEKLAKECEAEQKNKSSFGFNMNDYPYGGDSNDDSEPTAE